MISRFQKILTALNVFMKDKRFLKNMMKGGRSLASYQLNLAIRSYCDNFKTIFDVGANKGQFAFAASQIFPGAKIYSFEPVPEVFEELRKNTSGVNNISIYNRALGSEEGEIKFYKNKYSHASSALPIHENQISLMPGTSDTEVISVNVGTLDEFISKIEVSHPSLLKLDVQGFEKKVLLGGAKALKDIDYLLFESSFIEMYQGEPLFDEMHRFVMDSGFVLLAPVGFLQAKNGQIPQMDLLYKRKEN